MYLRPAHRELHLPTLYKFIRSHPFAVLTTAIKSPNYPLLQSSHIPLVLDLPKESGWETEVEGGGVRLRGHLAKANPMTKALIEVVENRAQERGGNEESDGAGEWGEMVEEEVMVVFTSNVEHYVTPKFYVETKPSTGKVVPTWNYAAVQVYGKAKIFHDGKKKSTGEFLTRQLDDLSRLAEEDVMGFDGKEGRKEAWTVEEAPESYTTLLKKAIIGIEIEVTSMAGKWKMSQELSEKDRQGTIEGFEKLGTPGGKEIAGIIRERGELKASGKNTL